MNSGHYVEGIPVLCQITSLIGYLWIAFIAMQCAIFHKNIQYERKVLTAMFI